MSRGAGIAGSAAGSEWPRRSKRSSRTTSARGTRYSYLRPRRCAAAVNDRQSSSSPKSSCSRSPPGARALAQAPRGRGDAFCDDLGKDDSGSNGAPSDDRIRQTLAYEMRVLMTPRRRSSSIPAARPGSGQESPGFTAHKRDCRRIEEALRRCARPRLTLAQVKPSPRRRPICPLVGAPPSISTRSSRNGSSITCSSCAAPSASTASPGARRFPTTALNRALSRGSARLGVRSRGQRCERRLQSRGSFEASAARKGG